MYFKPSNTELLRAGKQNAEVWGITGCRTPMCSSAPTEDVTALGWRPHGPHGCSVSFGSVILHGFYRLSLHLLRWFSIC